MSAPNLAFVQGSPDGTFLAEPSDSARKKAPWRFGGASGIFLEPAVVRYVESLAAQPANGRAGNRHGLQVSLKMPEYFALFVCLMPWHSGPLGCIGRSRYHYTGCVGDYGR